MRELSSQEICEVGGGINFTTPITMTLLNDVAIVRTISPWVSGAFAAGYFVGTKLNERFNLSGKLVDLLP